MLSFLEVSEEAPRPTAHPAAHPAAPAAAPRAAAEAAAPAGGARLDPRLEQLLTRHAETGPVPGGRVHLLNLEPIKARLGDRWPNARDRVRRTIETELQGRLGRHDFFSHSGENGYVIVFGDCSEAEAKLKIALLAEAALAKLFGGKEAEELRALAVRSVVTEADGRLATRLLDSTESLLASFDDAQPLPADDHRPESRQDSALDEAAVAMLLAGLDEQLKMLRTSGEQRVQPQLVANRLHEILGHLRALEGKMVRRLDDLAAAGGPDRPDIKLNPGLIRVAHHSLKTLRQIKHQAETELETHEQAAATLPTESEPALEQADLRVLYRPYWHAPSRKVAVYAPEAQLVTSSGALASDRDAVFDEEIEEAVDRLVLLHGRRDLEAAIKAHSPAIVAISIHYGTLARIGSRRRYLDLCRNIRAEDRSFVLWQLLGLPRQAFQSQLRGFVEQLRPFGRSISVMLTLTEQTFPHLAHDLELIALSGVAAVGLDAGQLGAEEKELIRLFDYVAKVSEAARLKCYATGIETSSLVLAATCAGFSYVAGPAVAEPLTRLDGVKPAEFDRIYLGKAEAAGTGSDETAG
ncbi:hypothetical protein [Tistlia consotensis]|uniref:hypothetical protein n=1 Tax=Tistlia consotensis TaxID=1321365 RepID=UPI000A147762|nr:hypothetical protein [Tistlia consotensis]